MASQEAVPESYRYDESANVPDPGLGVGGQAINGAAEEIDLPEDLPEPPGKTAFEELAQPSAVLITQNTSIYGTGEERKSDKDSDFDSDDDT